MKHDECLKLGLLIPSGVIEGACRYVVKDRMERTGTRWRESGAIAMLNLRTTKINDNGETCQRVFINRERKYMYDKKYRIDQKKWNFPRWRITGYTQ